MGKLNQKDLQILAHLRQNARKNLTKISKQTSVPVSTIFDKLKKYEGGIIKKHTALIDFKKLGYELKVNMLIRAEPEYRNNLREFLTKDLAVNSVYRINNGYDFLVEALFKNMLQLQEFNERLEKVGKVEKQEFYVLEELKEEEFISKPEIVDIFYNN